MGKPQPAVAIVEQHLAFGVPRSLPHVAGTREVRCYTANNLSVPIFGCTNHPVMSSTKFDVQYVAELARISLTPEEINTFQSQLGHVLEHVEKLNQLDLANVEPTAHSFPIYNLFREDREQPSLPHDLALSNAPRQAHGLFIVTKVVE